jgi:hypothetical protein
LQLRCELLDESKIACALGDKKGVKLQISCAENAKMDRYKSLMIFRDALRLAIGHRLSNLHGTQRLPDTVGELLVIVLAHQYS